MTIKHVYVKNGDGFGNKVYDLIFAVYLYNLYNKKNNKCNIYYVLLDSKNESKGDPKIFNIFQDSKKKIIFLTYKEYTEIQQKKTFKIHKLYDYIKTLNDIPKYDDLQEYTKFNDCFQLVYEMYSTFDEEDKNIFYNFNEKIITDKRVFDIKKIDYTLLHIRYGDKLNATKDNINKNIKDINKYLMYTPDYYIDMMHKHCDSQKFIRLLVIITDSPDIIKHYIVNRYQYKNNFIIFNSEWFNVYYLFYYAKIIILASSTFSISGALFNKNSTNVLLVDDNFINKNSSPELKNLPNNWITYNNNDNENYILNYNKNLILEMSKYNIYFKKRMSYQNTLIYKKNLKSVSNIQYNYKNIKSINSSDYLFSKTIKTLYKFQFPKNNFSINNISFGIELLLDKILNDNNIKECVFITRDLYLPATIKRLFKFSNIKVHNIYINTIYYDTIYNYNILYNYSNNDSLIYYDIKDDYGVEFDFHYDKYMFKINEYLLKIKNLKLCILVFRPNLILPFTLNSFINIANHCEKYEFIYTYSGILIIYHNITNYNINLSNLQHKFNRLMHTIAYYSGEDIMNEIIHAQTSSKSIASTYFIKFNDKIQSQNIKYNIEIIDLNYKVTNDKFVKKLLEYIYIEFDKLNYYLKLYTIENLKNELLFKDYYYLYNNIWYKFLNEDTKYNNIKQDLKELRNDFIFKNNNKLTQKQITNINNSYKTLSKKLSKILSKKLSKKLSKTLSKKLSKY